MIDITADAIDSSQVERELRAQMRGLERWITNLDAAGQDAGVQRALFAEVGDALIAFQADRTLVPVQRLRSVTLPVFEVGDAYTRGLTARLTQQPAQRPARPALTVTDGQHRAARAAAGVYAATLTATLKDVA